MLEIIGFSGQINIEVRHVELGPHPDYGTMRWSVEVHSHDMNGKYDEVGIWPSNYERFLYELVNLEQVRQGTASLTSMSPEELLLTFRPLDKLGHMMVEGQLGRYTYVGGLPHIQKMNFAFEFDPSLLPDLVRQFSAFKTW